MVSKTRFVISVTRPDRPPCIMLQSFWLCRDGFGRRTAKFIRPDVNLVTLRPGLAIPVGGDLFHHDARVDCRAAAVYDSRILDTDVVRRIAWRRFSNAVVDGQPRGPQWSRDCRRCRPRLSHFRPVRPRNKSCAQRPGRPRSPAKSTKIRHTVSKRIGTS